MTPLAPPFGSPRSGRKGFVPRQPILGTVDDLAVSPGDGQAVLTFSAPVGATKYMPQYKQAASGTWLDARDPGDLPEYPGGAGFTVTNLTNDVLHDFRIIAHDLFTTTTSAATQATPTASAGFGTVNDLAVEATQTDTTLDFNFTQVADDLGDPAKYAVRIRTPTLDDTTWGEAFDTEIFVDTSLAIGVTKSVQFTGLTAGTSYEALLIPFRGTPGSADAFGDFSNSAAGTTTGSSALGTISDLAATAGNTQVSLTWSPAANATSHQPEYKLSSSGTWLQFGSALGASASSVTVTGLTNGSAYDFRIEAGDGATTTTSNVDSATPTASSHPNEPAGFVKLREWDGTTLVPSGWTEVGPNAPVKHSLETEGGLPSGNPAFYRHTYPAGLSEDGKGTEYINTSGGGWFQSGSSERIYIHFWLRPSSNWVGHQSGTNKVVYFGSNDGGSFANHLFLKMLGVGSGTLNAVVEIQGLANHTDCADSSKLLQRNVGSSGDDVITRGSWTEIEILGLMNTTNMTDGTIEVWCDGTKIIDASGSDCWFEFTDGVERFIGLEKNSIWGGRGTGSLAQEQTLDIDGMYISGGPR